MSETTWTDEQLRAAYAVWDGDHRNVEKLCERIAKVAHLFDPSVKMVAPSVPAAGESGAMEMPALDLLPKREDTSKLIPGTVADVYARGWNACLAEATARLKSLRTAAARPDDQANAIYWAFQHTAGVGEIYRADPLLDAATIVRAFDTLHAKNVELADKLAALCTASAAQPRQYAHMCRSDHIEIGYSENVHDVDELNCPICLMRADASAAQTPVSRDVLARKLYDVHDESFESPTWEERGADGQTHWYELADAVLALLASPPQAAAQTGEREKAIEECIAALWERVGREEYGHAKAAVTLDIEALTALLETRP